jgi:hypothetical protein
VWAMCNMLFKSMPLSFSFLFFCKSSHSTGSFALQVADKLCSSFGQDILDSLFWTATEPRGRRREHFGLVIHVIMAIVYVCMLFDMEAEYTTGLHC